MVLVSTSLSKPKNDIDILGKFLKKILYVQLMTPGKTKAPAHNGGPADFPVEQGRKNTGLVTVELGFRLMYQ